MKLANLLCVEIRRLARKGHSHVAGNARILEYLRFVGEKLEIKMKSKKKSETRGNIKI